MGFNKYYIPEPPEFFKSVERIGPGAFVATRKIDAVVGSSQSILMLDLLYKLVKENIDDSNILKELKRMLK